VLSVIVNAALVGRLVKRLGEQRALAFGLGCGVVGFAIYGLAAQPWLFWLGLPISALWAVAQPAAQALMTREVGADAQGRLQGALMSLVSLIGIVAPLAYASTFGFFIGSRAPVHMPGAAFYLAAIVLFVAWVIAMRHARRVAEPAAA
jgi:DHA1 family tetracycline resistance protein-like MFS transporter